MTWGAIGGAAVTLVGSKLLSGHSGASSSGARSSTAAYDPYSQYRAGAASKLNSLMQNPGDLQNLPEYKARMMAASRTMAAQGYTGSGNALVAAAEAGGQAYQQAFQNLAMLSGANANPAYAQASANQQANYQQRASNQMWGQIGGIAGNVISNWGNSSIPSVDASNPIQIAQPNPGPVAVDNTSPNIQYTAPQVQF